MKSEFTTFEIEKLLGIKRNCLQPWIDQGYVVPSIQKATRRGTKNIFSLHDLYRIRLFDKILSTGINRKLAAEYADIVFDNVGPNPEQLKYCVFVRGSYDTENGSPLATFSFKLKKNHPTIELRKDDWFAFVVNILNIKEEVDKLVM